MTTFSMRVQRFLAAFICASCLLAQEAPLFPTPAYFKQQFEAPQSRVVLQPPVRLDDFVAGGKLELSLRSYLELVLANNTDVAIQKLSLEIPKNAIMRAFSIYDPSLVASFTANRTKSASTSVLQGASLLNTLAQNADFGYQQTLVTGTQVNVGFGGTKNSSNDSFATFNPALSSNVRFGFTQPLLRGRGAYITRIPILQARSLYRKNEYDLRDQLLSLVNTAENAYWDVIRERENLKVQEQFLALSDALLTRSKREKELGAISELDMYRPEQNKASAEIQVSQFRYSLAQREDALRKQVGADLDPNIRKLPIVLTETVLPTVDQAALDRELLVEKALATRPDFKSVLQSLDMDDLSITSTKNSLRPDLSLTGSYQSRGRGGTFYQRSNVFGGSSQLVGVVPGGFSDALDQMFGFGLPTYQFGVTLRLPIRDRARSMDFANAIVQKRMDALRVRTEEQRVRLDVLTAVNQVESTKDAVKLAKIARDFAQKQLDAEQKKYDLGISMIYFVQQAQTDLARAESDVVNQSIQYRRSLLTLSRMTGNLLEERGIRID
jgi:outer membrane protein